MKRCIEEILSTQNSVYYGIQKPKWIRSKKDAKAGDSVTVGGIADRPVEKPFPHFTEGYGIISGKRVYNGTLLCFDSVKWSQIAGGR